MSTKRNRNIHKGTKKIYINKLKGLYPSCKYDEQNTLYFNHKTYGEIEYEGIQKIYNYVKKKYNRSIDCFMDIGSGRGKLCLYMAAEPDIKKVLGVELMKERHDDAIKLKSELKSEYADKVVLLNKNVLKIDFEDYQHSNIFVLFNNLAFNDQLTDKIYDKLEKELPKGTILCCTRPPNKGIDILLNYIQVKASWDNECEIFFYRL
jgi:hypothetical protein